MNKICKINRFTSALLKSRFNQCFSPRWKHKNLILFKRKNQWWKWVGHWRGSAIRSMKGRENVDLFPLQLFFLCYSSKGKLELFPLVERCHLMLNIPNPKVGDSAQILKRNAEFSFYDKWMTFFYDCTTF